MTGVEELLELILRQISTGRVKTRKGWEAIQKHIREETAAGRPLKFAKERIRFRITAAEAEEVIQAGEEKFIEFQSGCDAPE